MLPSGYSAVRPTGKPEGAGEAFCMGLCMRFVYPKDWICRCGSTNKKNRGRGLCYNCYQSEYQRGYLGPDQTDEQREHRRKVLRGIARRKYYTLRDEMFEALGKKCADCGISTEHVLSLDHINNDGADHRRSLGTNGRMGTMRQVILDVKRRGWPKEEFQILCFNCNIGKKVLLSRKYKPE